MDDSLRFPPEWDNDTRMSVLFAPFRDKFVNPKAWEQKLQFWTKFVADVCRQKNFFLFDLKSLTACVKRREKVPLCLDTVIQEMLRSGRLKDASAYQTKDSSWLQWGLTTFVRKPVSWGVGYLLRRDATDSSQYVLLELLEEQAERVMEEHYRLAPHQWTDAVVEISEFRSQCCHQVPSDEEFAILMQHLQAQKKILVAQTPQGETVIKFCRKTDKQVLPIQEIELNIFRIQKVERALEKQIEALSEQIDGYMHIAKECLKQGKRSMALHNLRKKKAAQKSFDQKAAAQNKLQIMLQQIDDAASNEMVVKAFEYGISSMKAVNKDTNVDRIGEVMDDLQETMTEQGEVSMLLAEGGPEGTDQETLEAELDALMAATPSASARASEAGSSSNQDELLDALNALSLDPDLPSIPAHSPSADSQKKSRVELYS